MADKITFDDGAVMTIHRDFNIIQPSAFHCLGEMFFCDVVDKDGKSMIHMMISTYFSMQLENNEIKCTCNCGKVYHWSHTSSSSASIILIHKHYLEHLSGSETIVH